MPKFSFELDVRDPPAKVIGAMVDFSERRPEIWPNLTARLYRVHFLGPGTADVTEGTALPGVDVWERVTYEWTDSVVRGVLTDGRIFRPGGTFDFRVEPHGDGSRLTMHLHYGGGLFGPVLERVLRDEIERSRPRLLAALDGDG